MNNVHENGSYVTYQTDGVKRNFVRRTVGDDGRDYQQRITRYVDNRTLKENGNTLRKWRQDPNVRDKGLKTGGRTKD